MRIDTHKPDTVKPTSTLPVSEQEQEFNWKQCWYPVAFLQDLPKDRPYSFSLYDEPFVLFRNHQGKLVCLIDRCPHRAAKLSDGQIIDGKIECLYHGWQFGGEGECLHIPQLPTDAKIPANACVQSFKVVECQGMIWMWAGEAQAANEELIPTIADLDKPEFVSTDYMRDLPYDQTYLIENIIDPAHVFISHDGSEGSRKHAQPLEIEILEISAKGIRGRWRGTQTMNILWQQLDFIAPNLVHYQINFSKSDWLTGLALYALPLGQGRCRLLLRRYRNFLTRKVQMKPRWLEHLRQNRILEEDMPLVVGQQAEIQRLEKSLKEIFLPLKTSDTLVVEYRKWLDKFGTSLPYYQGYSTSKNLSSNECNQQSVQSNRFLQHTHICSSCNQTYQITNRLKQACVGVAIGMAALAILTDGSWGQIVAVSTSVLAVLLAVVADKAKTKFERFYTRH